MGWTTPRTWTIAEFVTKSILDTHIRDNLNAVRGAGCQVRHSNLQSIPTGVFTTVAFDTENYDTDAFHDTVTNNSRITIPSGLDGIYLFNASVRYVTGSVVGLRWIRLMLNGATIIGESAPNSVPLESGNPVVLAVSTQWNCVATNYVEVQTLQDCGGAINIDAIATHQPLFSAMMLRPV